MNIRVLDYEIYIQQTNNHFDLDVKITQPEQDVAEIHLCLTSEHARMPDPLTLSWLHPLIKSHHKWHPAAHLDRTLGPDWKPHAFTSKSTSHAPVYTLYGADGQNALTFALSDGLNPMRLSVGVVEETACADCQVTLFVEPVAPLVSYSAILRLDRRSLPYSRALQDVSAWWAGLTGYQPTPVPEHSRLPIYSTWYSFHQKLNDSALEAQCKMGKKLGMDVVIVDDGWQTDDTSRGYTFCGDWEISSQKFTNFAEHVARVHDLGMKYMLWFSVPFVGVETPAYRRFQKKILDPESTKGWHVLDPRYPDVRRYLLDIYRRFVTDYDVDGFKLDFVDEFQQTTYWPGVGEQDADPVQRQNGRDYESIPAAVDQLLSEVREELRQLKPDILIEFRQTYTGPRMRKYGNMLRAGDVPNDFASNRVRTLDLRLLAGGTPVHADMMVWHSNEPVESAAMQLIHTLFAVPQISVRLDQVPPSHLQMLRFYLNFWRSNRDVLLDGVLHPHRPEHLYPVVEAATDQKHLVAFYGQTSLSIDEIPQTLLLVNGTFDQSVLLDISTKTDHDEGSRSLAIYDCCGNMVEQELRQLQQGLNRIDIPPAGVAIWALAKE